MYQTRAEFDDIIHTFDIVPKLVGEKVFLGSIEPDMSDEFRKWLMDASTAQWIGKLPCVVDPDSEAAYVEEMLSRENAIHFAVYDRAEGILIGNCCVFHIDTISRTAELGIMIGSPDHRGKGRGREVISMLCAFCFTELNLHRVELDVLADNERARRCYESCGLRECGRRHECEWHSGAYHDVVTMELLRRNWKKEERHDELIEPDWDRVRKAGDVFSMT